MTLPLMLPGDILVSDNADFSDVAHLVTDVVANGIEIVTGSNLSHAMMVYEDPALLIESTILNGKSGPQLHPIEERIRTTRGRLWHLSLDPHFRDYLDFDAMWRLADRKLAVDRYAIGGLVKWLASHAPFLQYVKWFQEPIRNQEFCSQLCVELLQAGGQLPGINAAETSPADLASFRIYSEIRQLCGRPGTIKDFNCC
jgi:hypothetical protein